MLKPNEPFLRRFHRIEPSGRDFCIHIQVVTAQKEVQRNRNGNEQKHLIA
jgi:hypothetical protein